MLDFVAIDFETANEKGESVCALGLAEVKSGEIVEQQSWLIRPPDEHFTIRKRNREIHGLGRPDLKNEQLFSELWPNVARYFENQIIVAHNAASTEISHLRKLFKYFSIDPPNFSFLCTMQLARASWYESLEKCGLEQIASLLGCEFSHHDPKDDARVCAEFLIRACNDAGVGTIEELAESIDIPVVPFAQEKMEPKNSHAGGGIFGVSLSLSGEVSTGYFDDEMIDNTNNQSSSCYDFNSQGIEERAADPGTYNRGQELYESNKAVITTTSGLVCEGQVFGSGKKPYNVTLSASLGGECNCPAWINSSNRFCKHCVALALLWVSEGGPTPVHELSCEEQREALAYTVRQLSHNECKEVLLALVDDKPELLSRLLYDQDS